MSKEAAGRNSMFAEVRLDSPYGARILTVWFRSVEELTAQARSSEVEAKDHAKDNTERSRLLKALQKAHKLAADATTKYLAAKTDIASMQTQVCS